MLKPNKNTSENAATKYERTCAEQHKRLVQLHSEAIEDQKRATEKLQAGDIDGAAYSQLITTKRQATEAVNEFTALVARAEQEWKRAKQATADAAIVERAARAQAVLNEGDVIEKELTEGASKFLREFLAPRLLKLHELDERAAEIQLLPKGRTQHPHPGPWRQTPLGEEFKTAMHLAEVRERAEKLAALNKNAPARAARFALGDLMAWNEAK